MANVNLSAINAVFPGAGQISAAAQTVHLQDNSGGPNNGYAGDGMYTVSMNSAGGIVVTAGPEPSQSSTLQHITNAVVLGGVAVSTNDRRTLDVPIQAVNATIMYASGADGSYLATGSVTPRTYGWLTTETFTVPAVGASGILNVTLGGAFQDGATILIPKGTTPDQQPWQAVVASGGGSAALTVITTSLGTYSIGGTIATGAPVTFGQVPTQLGPQPQITASGVNFSFGATLVLTLSGANVAVGERMYAAAAWSTNSPNVITPPSGWTPLGPTVDDAATAMACYYRDVVAGDGMAYTWGFSGADSQSGWIMAVSGGNFADALFTIAGSGNNAITPTAMLVPTAPLSLAVAFFTANHIGGASPPDGWAQIGLASNGGYHPIVAQQAPPTATLPIAGICTFSGFTGYSGAALLIIPPSAGVSSVSASGGGSVSYPLPVASGGTGTSTPGLVAGSNVTITGTWPNQTINSTASGGGGGVSYPLAVASGGTGTSTPALAAGSGITLSGSFPDQTVNGLTIAGSGGNWTFSASGAAVVTISGRNVQIYAPSGGGGGGGPSYPLPVASGGNGTATPALTQGTNVTITGTWPNYTIAAASGGTTGGGFYDMNRLAIASIINYWPLNESSGTTAFDKKGSSNLTYSSGGVTYGTGLGMLGGDTGVIFDGTSGIAKGTPTMPSSSGFTVEWVSSVAVNGVSAGLTFVGGFNVSTLDGFNLNTATPSSVYPQKIGGNAGGAALGALTNSAGVPSFYALHLFHFIYDGAIAYIYCNNELMSKTTVTAWTQANFLAIGGYSIAGTAGGFISGTFAKFGLYSAVLTDNQRSSALSDLHHQ